MTVVRIAADMAGRSPDEAYDDELVRWATFGDVTDWRLVDDRIVLDVQVTSRGARIALEAAVRERSGATVVQSVTGGVA